MRNEVLAAVSAEMVRQLELHPRRPRHPFHWTTVMVEEGLEAMEEFNRLLLATTRTAQDQAEGADVAARLEAARRLRVELIQLAAVALAHAETLPASKGVSHV